MDDDDKVLTQHSLLRSQCIRYIQYNFILFYYICLIYGKSLLLVVGLYGHTEMYSSVELCITGNLSLGSVGLHSSVQLCMAKGWFADDSYSRYRATGGCRWLPCSDESVAARMRKPILALTPRDSKHFLVFVPRTDHPRIRP